MRSLVFMLCLLASVSSFARSGVYLAVRGGLSDVRETSQVDTHEAGAVPSAGSGELLHVLFNDVFFLFLCHITLFKSVVNFVYQIIK